LDKKCTHRVQGFCLIRLNALLLLLFYAAFLFKPTLPYLDYMLRKDFIIEKLCINKNVPEKQCNGKCHLEKQIRNNTDQTDDTSTPPIPKNEKNECQEYLVFEQKESCHMEHLLFAGSGYQRIYSFQYVPTVFRPPMLG